jgi:Ca2+-binding EF-hand superfamily protein
MADPNNYEKVKDAFKAYDIDRSGYLSRTEYRNFINHLVPFLESNPTLAQAIKKLPPGGMTAFSDQMFASADRNGDGKVSLEEFEKVIELFSY